MSAIVFIGPTISEDEVKSVLDAECWPPAAQGDVFRAARSRPHCLGVIDGYFDGVASVWHKEILWAISEGIEVFGASSMGALRAAELCEFGMTGVGQVFRSYKSGAIEDDDEVAVVHGPAELGFIPLSEPMVNIRPTLELARGGKLLSQDQMDLICSSAKSLNYPERTWEQILEHAEGQGLASDAAAALAEWVPKNRVDQKKYDAFELVELMKSRLDGSGRPPQPGFDFEHTLLWQQGIASWSGIEERTEGGREVLDELIFSDQHYLVRQRALARMSAVERAFERDLEFDPAEQREASRQFREQQNLLTGAEFRTWLSANDLSENEFKQLLLEELCVARAAEEDPEMFDEHALSVLKLSGLYETLSIRAKSKLDALEELDVRADVPPPPSELRAWFFQERPNFGDCGSEEAFMAAHGLQSKDEFYTILAREYLYLKKVETDA